MTCSLLVWKWNCAGDSLTLWVLVEVVLNLVTSLAALLSPVQVPDQQ